MTHYAHSGFDLLYDTLDTMIDENYNIDNCISE